MDNDLKTLLRYEPETGLFYWVGSASKASRRPVGTIAGTRCVRGYITITAAGKVYKTHRLAWWWVNGVFPERGIDHINGVKDDNRISNLREADQSLNSMNRKTRQNARSGFKGASWHSRSGKWRAQICLQGKNQILGEFATAEEAHQAYCLKARELFGEFFRAA